MRNIFWFLLVLLLLISHSQAFSIENRGVRNAEEVGTAVYGKPGVYVEDLFYLDASWRVQTKNITILGISYYLGNITNITFYDVFANVVIHQTNFSSAIDNTINPPFFYSFTIPVSSFQQNSSRYIAIRSEFFTNGVFDNDEGPIYVYLANESLPSIVDWYSGDTHVHSIYSDNEAEFGAPLNETDIASKEIGLTWFTGTDHTLATRFEKGWGNYTAECSSLATCIRAAEISCSWFVNGTEYFDHYLGYNHSNYIHGGERLTEVTPIGNTLCSEIESRLNSDGGFGYVAHPLLNDVLRLPWPNYSVPYTGLELWNKNGPEEKQMRDEGLQILDRETLNQKRRIYMSGGSDAHGDFNNELGRPMTACYANPFSKDAILASLKGGNCFMTDGPALIFTINNKSMGSVVDTTKNTSLNISITYNSTEEFGLINVVRVLRNGNLTQLYLPNNYTGTIEFTGTEEADVSYRIEVETSKGYTAYTNPIYTSFTKPLLSAAFGKPDANTFDNQEIILTIQDNNWNILQNLKLYIMQKDVLEDITPPLSFEANQTIRIPIGRRSPGNLTVYGNATDIFGNVHIIQGETIFVNRLVLTSMNYNESLKVIDFVGKYNKTPAQLFFDGLQTTSPTLFSGQSFDTNGCDMPALKMNLGINASVQFLFCEKQIVEGENVMWVSFYDAPTDRTILFHQIGNQILLDYARYTELKQVVNDGNGLHYIYYLRRWVPDSKRYSFYRLWGSINPTGGSNIYLGSLGAFMIHGMDVRNNRTNIYHTTSSVQGTIFAMDTDLIAKIKIDGNTTVPFSYLPIREHINETHQRIYDIKSFDFITQENISFGINGSYEVDICCPRNKFYEVYNTEPENIFLPRRTSSYLIVRIDGTNNVTLSDDVSKILLSEETGIENYTLVKRNESHLTFVLNDTDKNYSIGVSSHDLYTIMLYLFDNERLSLSTYSINGVNDTSLDTFFLEDGFSFTTYETTASSKTFSRNYQNMSGALQTYQQTYSTDNKHRSRFRSGAPENREYIENQYAPEIISYGPENNTVFNEGSNISIAFDAIDQNGDSLSFAIFFDGNVISYTNNTKYYLENTSSGNHTLLLHVNDSTNRSSNITLNIQVLDISELVTDESDLGDLRNPSGGDTGVGSPQSSSNSQTTSASSTTNTRKNSSENNSINDSEENVFLHSINGVPASFENSEKNSNSLTGNVVTNIFRIDLMPLLKKVWLFILEIADIFVFWN